MQHSLIGDKSPFGGTAGSARRNPFQTCQALVTFWRNAARKFFLSHHRPQCQPRRFVHLRPHRRAPSIAGKPIRLAGVSSLQAVAIHRRPAGKMRRRLEPRTKSAPARCVSSAEWPRPDFLDRADCGGDFLHRLQFFLGDGPTGRVSVDELRRIGRQIRGQKREMRRKPARRLRRSR